MNGSIGTRRTPTISGMSTAFRFMRLTRSSMIPDFSWTENASGGREPIAGARQSMDRKDSLRRFHEACSPHPRCYCTRRRRGRKEALPTREKVDRRWHKRLKPTSLRSPAEGRHSAVHDRGRGTTVLGHALSRWRTPGGVRPASSRPHTAASTDSPVAIRFDADTLARLKAVAEKKHKGYQTLLKEFVAERLYEEEKREGILPANR